MPDVLFLYIILGKQVDIFVVWPDFKGSNDDTTVALDSRVKV